MTATAAFHRELKLLSQLALAEDGEPAVRDLMSADDESRTAFLRLAHGHHVVIRSLRPLQKAARTGGASGLEDWIASSLAREEARIANALEFLKDICGALESAGCPTTIMKSLDHWPDIGNDLDLYCEAAPEATQSIMRQTFQANAQPRTWGDRLAQKNSYRVPGLRATVEIHHGRLGQTGEHRFLAHRFITRRIPVQLAGQTFFVPAPEEQVIAATLQRMYRHFYVRICDVANTAALIDSAQIDNAELRHAARQAGIWLGVVSYLQIVADYFEQYRGRKLSLPGFVTGNPLLGGKSLFVRGPWLRVPVFPVVATLYGQQMTAMLRHGDALGVLRLSLLPPLASAATLAHKITGTPRGIW